jgi:hypothetical protein
METSERLRQGCPLSPVLFDIYIDSVIKEWKEERKQNVSNTILFSDCQVIMTNTENDMQSAVYKLHNAATKYNLVISANKTNGIAFKGNTV